MGGNQRVINDQLMTNGPLDLNVNPVFTSGEAERLLVSKYFHNSLRSAR